jgi:hypothetical protein
VPPVIHPPGSPRRNKHGYLTQAAIDTATHLRERGRRKVGEPAATTEPNPEDRFPDEPPF